MPNAKIDHDELLSAAEGAKKDGRFDLAEEFYRRALQVAPSSAEAKSGLGYVLARRADYGPAEALLSQSLKERPGDFSTSVSLSYVFQETGRLEAAIELCQRLCKGHAARADAHALLAGFLWRAHRLLDAEKAYLRGLQLEPNRVDFYRSLGSLREAMDRFHDAAEAFERAAGLSGVFEDLSAAARANLLAGDSENAEFWSRKALDVAPESDSSRLLLAGALIPQGKEEEAKRLVREAMDLGSEGEGLQLATRQRQLGMIEEAAANLRSIIAEHPDKVWAYKSLMLTQKATAEDRPLIDSMRRLVSGSGLTIAESAALHYALGKALEDLGQYEESMLHYDEANRSTRQQKVGFAFNRTKYHAYIDFLMEQQQANAGGDAASDSPLPILIVGMMRSGTTLVEQILSSHPLIGAAGELFFWGKRWREAMSDPALGRDYLETLERFAPGLKRITDKMPNNYQFLGLIHRILPNARIVHVRRSPVDTCLSIWATPNGLVSDGGHDKGQLVFTYREYLRLMAHWRRCLPRDRFFEIDYESLVEDGEAITRAMIDFIGLEWNDACLSPEKNARMVSTPSLWQVRQPVYQTSVARWRKFEPWLGEFRDLLDLVHEAPLN
jgi:tetratricopeptide (TPR) repeat protein